jgi:hypothetical protein
MIDFFTLSVLRGILSFERPRNDYHFRFFLFDPFRNLERVLFLGEDVESGVDGDTESSGERTKEGREDVGAKESWDWRSGAKEFRGTFSEGDETEGGQ